MGLKPLSVCVFAVPEMVTIPHSSPRRANSETFLPSVDTGWSTAPEIAVSWAKRRGAMQQAGGHVTGVIPQHLVDAEVGKDDVNDYIVTTNMHERKMLMFERSDAVATLPGGPGTLDELIEVLTWRQLGLHRKPLILMNVEGYWDPLLTLLQNTISHAFADATVMSYLTVVKDAADAIETLDAIADST